jgi:hypothetical protein
MVVLIFGESCNLLIDSMTYILLTLDSSSKREARRHWKEEWGNLDTEGNMWWTGSKKQGWIDVMGRNPLGWICESLPFLSLYSTTRSFRGSISSASGTNLVLPRTRYCHLFSALTRAQLELHMETVGWAVVPNFSSSTSANFFS